MRAERQTEQRVFVVPQRYTTTAIRMGTPPSAFSAPALHTLGLRDALVRFQSDGRRLLELADTERSLVADACRRVLACVFELGTGRVLEEHFVLGLEPGYVPVGGPEVEPLEALGPFCLVVEGTPVRELLPRWAYQLGFAMLPWDRTPRNGHVGAAYTQHGILSILERDLGLAIDRSFAEPIDHVRVHEEDASLRRDGIAPDAVFEYGPGFVEELGLGLTTPGKSFVIDEPCG